MRSGKVDLSVSSSNQDKASWILQKMREPAAPVSEEVSVEMPEEGPPPKLALPPMMRPASILHNAATLSTALATPVVSPVIGVTPSATIASPRSAGGQEQRRHRS